MNETFRWDLYLAGRFWFTTAKEASALTIREVCGLLTASQGVTVTALVAEEVAA